MQINKSLIAFGLPLIATSFITACDGGLDARGGERTLALEPGEEGDFPIAEGEASIISISNNIGKVTLRGGSDGTNVSVSTEQGPDYAALADEGIVVYTYLEGDQLVVLVEGPDGAEQAVDIEIEAPEELILAIRGDEHTITVSGMRGTGSVDSSSGDIDFSDYLGGDLALNSTDGDISFSASEFGDSRVAIHTVSGDIEANVPSDAAFTLAAQAGSGHASVSGFDLDGATYGGIAAGDVNGGGSELSLLSEGGNVSVDAN